jgi:hypothetical protein
MQKAACFYTQHANFGFQALAAEGATFALWLIFKECILGRYWNQHFDTVKGYGNDLADGALAYSHPVNFIHDEIVCEHPEGDVPGKRALKRQEDLMVSAMQHVCQNLITIRVEGKLSAQWEH